MNARRKTYHRGKPADEEERGKLDWLSSSGWSRGSGIGRSGKKGLLDIARAMYTQELKNQYKRLAHYQNKEKQSRTVTVR